jgi:hypothetical protein
VVTTDDCPHNLPREPKNANDSIAKRLAGFRTPDDVEVEQCRLKYEKFIAEQWNTLEQDSLSLIEPWALEYISPFLQKGDTLFYPFGGPDIAYPLRFFPSVHEYVLVGLEPIGNLDAIARSLKNEASFVALEKAIYNYLGKGFFITSEMLSQFSNKNYVNGVLCLILLELAKLEFDIDDIEEISINSNGRENARGKGILSCVKITFSKKGDTSPPKTIYYLKANLHNSSVGHINALKKFMDQRQFVTLVKSASYAMHDSSFSKIRNLILNDSKLLLQDDSGIPFCYFGDKWEKFIFGEYTVPTLKTFRKNKQNDLADYYASNEKLKIPFKIGYGFNQERPNLLLVVSPQRQKKRKNLMKMFLPYLIFGNPPEGKFDDIFWKSREKTTDGLAPQSSPLPPIEYSFVQQLRSAS